ncbi:hypothetical protein ACJ41O_014169 [Fusarium nematophilum]
MESWRAKGLNYLTSDPEKWVILMNLSTVEWGIGYLPPTVVAVPGSLNSSHSFPDDAIVIQHAGQDKAGSRDTEKIIFGLASGIVIIAMALWLCINRRNLLHPQEQNLNGTSTTNLDGGGDGTDAVSLRTTTTEFTTYGEDFLTEKDFCERLRVFYYQSDKSELEAVGRDIYDDGLTEEDIEAASALLRKMYTRDLELWSNSESVETTPAERNRLKFESDAILAEVNRLVNSWEAAMGDSEALSTEPDERDEMAMIVTELASFGPQRYPDKQRWDESRRKRTSKGSKGRRR